MNRRIFMGSFAALGVAGTSRAETVKKYAMQNQFALSEISISDLQDQMVKGRTTSRRLVEKYSQRIADLDRRGPRLNHVLEINPDARKIAERLDEERRTGHVRGPLHGIP